MSDKIDLPLSRVSMRRHHAARTRVLVLCVGCGVLLALTLWALWRSWPKIMGWLG